MAYFKIQHEKPQAKDQLVDGLNAACHWVIGLFKQPEKLKQPECLRSHEVLARGTLLHSLEPTPEDRLKAFRKKRLKQARRALENKPMSFSRTIYAPELDPSNHKDLNRYLYEMRAMIRDNPKLRWNPKPKRVWSLELTEAERRDLMAQAMKICSDFEADLFE